MDDFRKKYNQEYYELGSKMFSNCNIPTVYDFVDAFVHKKDAAMKRITKITDFTGNHKDIINSVNRRNDMYSDADQINLCNLLLLLTLLILLNQDIFIKN